MATSPDAGGGGFNIGGPILSTVLSGMHLGELGHRIFGGGAPNVGPGKKEFIRQAGGSVERGQYRLPAIPGSQRFGTPLYTNTNALVNQWIRAERRYIAQGGTAPPKQLPPPEPTPGRVEPPPPVTVPLPPQWAIAWDIFGRVLRPGERPWGVENPYAKQQEAARKKAEAAKRKAEAAAKRKAAEYQRKIEAQKKRAAKILADRANAQVPKSGGRGAGSQRRPWEAPPKRPGTPSNEQVVRVVIETPEPKAPAAPKSRAPSKNAGLERVVVTARRVPVPVPPPPAPSPWLKYGQLVAPLIPSLSSLLNVGPNRRRSRARDPLTVPQTPGLPSTATSPFAFSGFGGVGAPTSTKTCECAKKRKRGPKKKRTVCYKGSYVERASGITKRKRERVPCQA
jgi:hypothetical protein